MEEVLQDKGKENELYLLIKFEVERKSPTYWRSEKRIHTGISLIEQYILCMKFPHSSTYP